MCECIAYDDGSAHLCEVCASAIHEAIQTLGAVLPPMFGAAQAEAPRGGKIERRLCPECNGNGSVKLNRDATIIGVATCSMCGGHGTLPVLDLSALTFPHQPADSDRVRGCGGRPGQPHCVCRACRSDPGIVEDECDPTKCPGCPDCAPAPAAEASEEAEIEAAWRAYTGNRAVITDHDRDIRQAIAFTIRRTGIADRMVTHTPDEWCKVKSAAADGYRAASAARDEEVERLRAELDQWRKDVLAPIEDQAVLDAAEIARLREVNRELRKSNVAKAAEMESLRTAAGEEVARGYIVRVQRDITGDGMWITVQIRDGQHVYYTGHECVVGQTICIVLRDKTGGKG